MLYNWICGLSMAWVELAQRTPANFLVAFPGQFAMAEEGKFLVKLHCGFNTSGSTGEGLEGLPGLLVTIAFVSIFLCIFLPPNASNWFLVLFLAVEIGASILYVLIDRRNLKESERLRKELHQINE